MSLGQTGSCFVNVTVPARGYLCDPHLPQMLLRCHDEAYAPLPYCQLFISGNILPKLKRSVESTCQKAEPHFNTLIIVFGFFFFTFAIAKAVHNAPFICFGAGFSSLFRRSGGIDCARIFACSWDWGRQCPVLTEDSHGRYRKA